MKRLLRTVKGGQGKETLGNRKKRGFRNCMSRENAEENLKRFFTDVLRSAFQPEKAAEVEPAHLPGGPQG